MMLRSSYFIIAILTLGYLKATVALSSPVECTESSKRPAAAGNDTSCPPWMSLRNGSCKCNMDNKLMRCCEYDQSLTLLACYCLSYYEELNKTVTGNCIYSCSLSYYHKIYKPEQSCKKFNRRGKLCGECEYGLGYPVYSYSSNCFNCTEKTPGIFKYIVTAYVPLTLFYILVVTFRISVTSERLSGYVMVCQIITMPAQVRYISMLSIQPASKRATSISLAVHSIWNLDFFKSFYQPFCFDHRLNSLAVVSLDYLIALYPLCLIILTYAIVKIHDKSPTLARVWKPLHKVFTRMRRSWNLRKSLVDCFATFLLLSYMKILNASFNILIPTKLRDMNGTVISSEYLYYDGSLQVFHYRHAFYTAIAIFMSLIFNFLPLLLLLLYPCHCFQSLLNRCDRSRFQLMHTFMDSFQGCYRLSPIDCRYFAAINLMVRILNLVVFSITLTRFYFLFTCFIFICLAILMVLLQPYRVARQNTIDTAFYLIVALGYLNAAGYALSPERFYNTILLVFMVTACAIAFLYTFVLLPYKVIMIPLYDRLRSLLKSRKRKLLEIDEELFNSMSGRDETTALLNSEPMKDPYSTRRGSQQNTAKDSLVQTLCDKVQ